MEGYSVTEAASVLGVPTERVWELLARGVLSGAAEGETGMRVYLQPRPAPAPVEPKAPNGNGGTGEPERELSPFRELLTEFRNLTERYGQALLALGEARGEVAALRSRVDLLEARMDLRLPMGPPQSAGWSSAPMPAPIERAVMAAQPESASPAAAGSAVEATAEALAEAPVEAEPSEEERRSRARGPRRATESFAEALARAEDPSPPELPGGTEAAAAVAASPPPAEDAADIGLPGEVAAADAIPVSDTEALVDDEPAPVAAVPEPVDLTPEPAVMEAQATFEPPEEPVELRGAVETETPLADVAPVEAEATPESTIELAAVAAAEAEAVESSAEPFNEAEPSVEAAPSDGAEPPLETAGESARDELVPEPVTPEVEPIAWDAERYTTDIEEPDWFAAEVADSTEEAFTAEDPAAEVPVADASPAAVPAVDESAPSQPEPEASPTIDDDGGEEDANGADEMEVVPSATQDAVNRPEPAPPDLTNAPEHEASISRAFPGARDLEDAIAALRAAGRAAEPPDPEPDAKAEEDEAETGGWPRSGFVRPATPGTGTKGQASRAYRRLRRIFPG